MWPGYIMDVKQVTDGIFVNIDTATKFLSSFTVLDEVEFRRSQWKSNSEIISELIPTEATKKRLVVITSHNSRIHQVDGINFNSSPKLHIIDWKHVDRTTNQVQ